MYKINHVTQLFFFWPDQDPTILDPTCSSTHVSEPVGHNHANWLIYLLPHKFCFLIILPMYTLKAQLDQMPSDSKCDSSKYLRQIK
jgi:hypothetical protein